MNEHTKRTHSDAKFRPLRREVSRYGKIEIVLNRLKKDPHVIGNGNVFMVKNIGRVLDLSSGSVAGILRFTKGVKNIGRGKYIFNGEEIKVENHYEGST